jgi:hypothetical protein
VRDADSRHGERTLRKGRAGVGEVGLGDVARARARAKVRGEPWGARDMCGSETCGRRRNGERG